VVTSGVRPRSYTTRIGRIREQEEDKSCGFRGGVLLCVP